MNNRIELFNELNKNIQISYSDHGRSLLSSDTSLYFSLHAHENTNHEYLYINQNRLMRTHRCKNIIALIGGYLWSIGPILWAC